ncbi:methionine synthase [uncultured Pseudokineococcus sp.]|uniref:methionine synthase n=1 Tax=uncultured Pseudokineococcus sp. TaxID=1642928 RepID=UPI00261996FF|nr:methionine synthase [uncultured Pseudokineococcus sp.]
MSQREDSPTEVDPAAGGPADDEPGRPALLGRASGTGSWPEQDPLEAARTVLGELGAPPGLPHVVEMPGRGPGAELVGRAAALLVGLPVDLQPSGWRFVDHPGRDLQRARSYRRADLDALAEAADGYAGELKAQVAGPWTLAASVRLGRGERSTTDPGARRDVVASLAEGVREHLADLARLVPGARLVLQLDEPSLGAVLDGRLRRSSGFGHLEPVPADEVEAGLRAVAEAAREAGAEHVVVHSCADDVPFPVLRRSGADGLSVDLSRLRAAGWESVAVAVEEGRRLWAGLGVADPQAGAASVDRLVEAVREPWRRVGLPLAGLADVVLTPACGLAGSSPAAARASLRRLREASDALGEAAQA